MPDKIKMSAIREQFPMYAEVPDEELIRGIHQRFYPQMPLHQLALKIDFDTGRDEARQRYAPTNDMGAIERWRAGVGSGMSDLALGVKQRLGFASPEDVEEKRTVDSALNKTFAGKFGNITGQVALALPTAWVPGANTLVGAGVVGGGLGALQPTTKDESVLKNIAIGGAGGVGGQIAGRAIGAGYQAAKAMVQPFTKKGQQAIAQRVLTQFAADPSKIASAAGSKTATGAAPTLAEATGDTGLATLERSLAQQDPQVAAAFLQRAADNNAARVGVVQNIAGDEAKRAAAVAARELAAGDMYQAATNAVYQMDGRLQNLLSRPAVQQAMGRAKTLAANQGREFAFEVPRPAALDALAGAGGETLRGKATTQITGQGLQDLKMALDDMLTDPTSGFAGQAGSTLKNLRGQIVDWMEQANPAFKQARTSYAAASKPINQMDVGQRLLDKTTAAMRDMGGNQRLQANAFARALNDEQALVRGATGFKGVNALEDVMDPQQIAALQAVRSELERVSNLASAANGPGSQTAKSLASQNLLRQTLGPLGLPQNWSEAAFWQTAMRPAQFAMQAAEPKIQNELARLLLNPAQAAEVMNATAGRGLLSSMPAGLLQIGNTAATQSVPAGLLSMSR